MPPSIGDGWRTSVNETSNRCRAGQRPRMWVKEESDNEVCRSFRARRFGRVRPSSIPVKRLEIVASVWKTTR